MKLSEEQKERLREHPLYNKARAYAEWLLREKNKARRQRNNQQEKKVEITPL